MPANQSTFDRGNTVLETAWANAAQQQDTTGIPADVVEAVQAVMQPERQVSHLYGLVTQLLIKATVNSDARQMKGIAGDEGKFNARSFADKTVQLHDDISSRLGGTGSAYVSNPLRTDRLEDNLLTGKGKQGWIPLLQVLDYANDHPETVEKLLSLALSLVVEWEPATDEPTPAETPPPKDDLSQLEAFTALTEDMLLDIIEVLKSDQPQVVFAGPPGTGKTHTALAIASYLVGDAHRVVQFHASYGYEEFVEGLRAVSTPGGGFEFALTPGVVRKVSETLTQDGPYMLILDEFNRANLPRVFGELLFAIERRGQRVDLMYTPDFELSPHVMFIATMNTADRSIRTLDAAIRRRFQFFDFAPSADVLESFYASGVDNSVEDLVDGFIALNTALTGLIDRHHTIGQTFLMEAKGMTPTKLQQVWDRQIFPLLEDYLFDQPDELGAMTATRFWPSIEGE